MPDPYSEISLQPQHDLLTGGEALYVAGVGYIAQYHCYVDKLYSHGVIYFVRDSLLREMTRVAERGTESELQKLAGRLNELNSKICAYESLCQ